MVVDDVGFDRILLLRFARSYVDLPGRDIIGTFDEVAMITLCIRDPGKRIVFEGYAS